MSSAPSLRLRQVIPLVERQHAVIEHLRARHPRRTTTALLADLVGASPRTIERDLDRLRDAGVPIHTAIGRHGGHRIAASPEESVVRLSPGEVSALLAAVVAIGPYSSAAAQTSMAKLLATFAPDEVKHRHISDGVDS